MYTHENLATLHELLVLHRNAVHSRGRFAPLYLGILPIDRACAPLQDRPYRAKSSSREALPRDFWEEESAAGMSCLRKLIKGGRKETGLLVTFFLHSPFNAGVGSTYDTAVL